MTTLTPTARTLLGLLTEGPATADQLRQRSGRGRSTVDRTITDLAGRDLIAPGEAGPDDDGTDRWTLTPAGRQTLDDLTAADGGHTDPPPAPDAAGQPEETHHDDEQEPDADPDVQGEPAEQIKTCRGCSTPIPPICPTCWQKTTVYCGTCRQTMPTTDRGAPREPQILSNGLPKLRPGELEHLILDVLAAHPVPDYGGVIGWTSGRIAVHLPGRSIGAINRVLDKLTTTGTLTQLGTDPKRYQPAAAPSGETNGEGDNTDAPTENNDDTDTDVTPHDDTTGDGPLDQEPHDPSPDGPVHDHTQ